ncbi:MAG: transcription termination factor NusA [Solobacterium sp.]|jgi:N utilization substance protein A|nr:transcription termination factor NusA [Solobacterium sp.]MCH4205628.1 transcription termination factor NusA [Solobacterium sp.]MCH4227179.1 transcription termination factor NusA [Solobacterium sp.]MCH4282458.1 transcription termination factor NusA [Solobacterium sp.]
MQLKLKDILGALNAVEEEKNIPEDVILDALCEAMAKAYKKDAELSDIDVTAVINQKKQTIDLIQSFAVVEEVEDDELEISLEDAKEIDPNAEIGGKVSRPIEFTTMSRAAASLARNVMRQKIREAEKTAVYDEYVDKTNELVIGIVESVKDKFTLVNLGRTVAMMPKSAQIPTERLSEGQQIRVIITEVNKDTKGSQVLVSRADSMLVKRLFEREVPEIFSGVVEIKAIAREAGERTKMAVLSHNPDVDPIGACIGPRGGRVQEVIEELHGEKIDIFQWSDDLTELVKNALAPAEIEAVLPVEDDDNALLVIVNEDQLSLAIGKRGKNARLAVKLTNHKIDIKTRAEIEEMGMDYDKLVAEAEAKKAEYHKDAEIKAVERKNTEAEEVQTRMQANAQKIAEAKAAQEELAESEDIVPDEMAESVSENLRTQMAMEPQEEEKTETEAAPAQEEETEPAEKEPAEEKPMEKKTDSKQTAKEVSNDKGTKHADLEELAAKNTYVSVFEKLASTSAPKQKTDVKFKRRKKKEDEEEFKVKNKDLEKQINTDKAAAKPVYTEEELAEIEAQQQKEENSEYDVDYDEYADYYKDEDNN